MKIILAGTYSQFIDYCYVKKLIPNKEAKCIHDDSHLRGLGYNNLEFIKIGTWYLLPDKLQDEFRRTESYYNLVNKKRKKNEVK